MSIKKFLVSLALISAITACSTSGRYSMSSDEAPHRLPTDSELVNPVPRQEPYSRQGNRAYTLFDKNYQIIENVQGYKEQGIASWYGRKFHGHLTSNGEYFDMFSMTAAHKTLPLPIYVKVTNLDNGKDAIVRVNDRGPFHPGRIIDLSYAAAYRLGITETGTAQVEVEVITPPLLEKERITDNKEHTSSQHHKPVAQLFIQVVATSSVDSATALQQKLVETYGLDATISQKNGLYRVLAGPFSEIEAARWLDKLEEAGYTGLFRTQEIVTSTEAH